MEHVKKQIKIRTGVDVGYNGSNIQPIDREGCVGASGIDKSYTLDMVMKLAYKLDNKPNIIKFSLAETSQDIMKVIMKVRMKL